MVYKGDKCICGISRWIAINGPPESEIRMRNGSPQCFMITWMIRKTLKDTIEGTNKNITPGKWREELKKIDDSIGDIDKEFNKVANELARVEVLEHNKKELKLFLENERHKGRSERQLINEFQR